MGPLNETSDGSSPLSSVSMSLDLRQDSLGGIMGGLIPTDIDSMLPPGLLPPAESTPPPPDPVVTVSKSQPPPRPPTTPTFHTSSLLTSTILLDSSTPQAQSSTPDQSPTQSRAAGATKLPTSGESVRGGPTIYAPSYSLKFSPPTSPLAGPDTNSVSLTLPFSSSALAASTTSSTSTILASSSSHRHDNTGLIIGCVVGGVVVLLLTLAIHAFLVKKHRRSLDRSREHTTLAETQRPHLPFVDRVLGLMRGAKMKVTPFQTRATHRSSREFTHIEEKLHHLTDSFSRGPTPRAGHHEPVIGQLDQDQRRTRWLSGSSQATLLTGLFSGGDQSSIYQDATARASSSFHGDEDHPSQEFRSTGAIDAHFSSFMATLNVDSNGRNTDSDNTGSHPRNTLIDGSRSLSGKSQYDLSSDSMYSSSIQFTSQS